MNPSNATELDVPTIMRIGAARMTAGLDRMGRIDLAAHAEIFGPLPRMSAEQLIEAAAQVDNQGKLLAPDGRVMLSAGSELIYVPGQSSNISIAAPAPAAPAKLSKSKLNEMKAKWSANKGKLKACRAEVKQKGLAGDDRWFYIEECMGKT